MSNKFINISSTFDKRIICMEEDFFFIDRMLYHNESIVYTFYSLPLSTTANWLFKRCNDVFLFNYSTSKYYFFLLIFLLSSYSCCVHNRRVLSPASLNMKRSISF